MGTSDLPYPSALDFRVARLEHRLEKLEDGDRQDVLLEKIEQLQKRVDRMATFAMAASALLVAVLGLLIRIVMG